MSSQDYIPWNAVATNWANRRAVWARRLRDCMDVSGVVKHLLQLEQEQPSPLIRVCPDQGAVCIASRLLHSALHIQPWPRPQTASHAKPNKPLDPHLGLEQELVSP